jgi:hypothetical protein
MIDSLLALVATFNFHGRPRPHQHSLCHGLHIPGLLLVEPSLGEQMYRQSANAVLVPVRDRPCLFIPS